MSSEKFRDLGPGEEASIFVEFSSSGFPLGVFARRIGLVTEGTKNWVYVEVAGEVGTVMVPEEKEIRLGTISRLRIAAKKITLRGRGDAPIAPVLANITVPFVVAELRSLTKYYWELNVILRTDQIPIGQLSGSYKIVIRDELNRQFLEIPVIWTRQVPITFDPNPLEITAAPGEEFEARLKYAIHEGGDDKSMFLRDALENARRRTGIPPTRVLAVRAEGAELGHWFEEGCIVITGKVPEDAEKRMNGYILVTLNDRDDPEHALRFAINVKPKAADAQAASLSVR